MRGGRAGGEGKRHGGQRHVWTEVGGGEGERMQGGNWEGVQGWEVDQEAEGGEWEGQLPGLLAEDWLAG